MAALTSTPPCAMCKGPLGERNRWVGDGSEAHRRLGKICGECSDSMDAVADGEIPLARELYNVVGGSRIIPPIKMPPPPDNYEEKMGIMRGFIIKYAEARGMKAKCLDTVVHTEKEWFRFSKMFNKPKHHDKIFLLTWDITKEWCIHKINRAICRGDSNLLGCSFVVYHKDSYIYGSLYGVLDETIRINIDGFVDFMDNFAGKPPSNCIICCQKMMAFHTCSTCKQKTCKTCFAKITECPFCRVPF